MKEYLFLAIGGVVGVILRYQLGHWIAEWNTTPFPWATLGINITGSLAVGFLMPYLAGNTASPELRLLMTTGFCGGFTTMSTFSYDLISLFNEHQYGFAALYFSSTTVLSPLACLAGFRLAALAI
jgi:CrcB protein